MSFASAARRAGHTITENKSNVAENAFRASNRVIANGVAILVDEGMTDPSHFTGAPACVAKSVFGLVHSGNSLDNRLIAVAAAIKKNYLEISLPYKGDDGKKKSVKCALFQISKDAKGELNAVIEAIRKDFPDFELDPKASDGKLGLPEEVGTLNADSTYTVTEPGIPGQTVEVVLNLARNVRRNIIQPIIERIAACKTEAEVREELAKTFLKVKEPAEAKQ